jgi:hypothetical protein
MGPRKNTFPHISANRKHFANSKERSMKFIRTTARKFGIAGELFSFFMQNKRWWLVPMILTLFLLGALIVLAQSSAIAPFIYTLF